MSDSKSGLILHWFKGPNHWVGGRAKMLRNANWPWDWYALLGKPRRGGVGVGLPGISMPDPETILH